MNISIMITLFESVLLINFYTDKTSGRILNIASIFTTIIYLSFHSNLPLGSFSIWRIICWSGRFLFGFTLILTFIQDKSGLFKLTLSLYSYQTITRLWIWFLFLTMTYIFMNIHCFRTTRRIIGESVIIV